MKRFYLIAVIAAIFFLGFLSGKYQWEFHISTGWTDTSTAISAIIGALVAVAALLVAILAIVSQRQSTRAQHTITHLAEALRDKDIIAAKMLFYEKAALPGGLAKYAHKENGKAEMAICTVLNHYELISLGIQCGTIDYEVFKCWNKSTVLKVWADASPFISETRKLHNSPMLWHEFEELARDFSSNKNPKRKMRNPLRIFL